MTPAAALLPVSWLARLEAVRDRTQNHRGWQRGTAAAVAGAVSVLAMAPLHAFPVLFATLPMLVWLLDGAATGPLPARRAAVIGWWFSFGYHLAGLYWIGAAFLVEADKFAAAMPFAVVAMPAGLALFWAAATAAAIKFWKPGVRRILVLAVALSIAEWLRGHILTGFPWNVLGYALTWPLPLMQWAGIVGIYGLTVIAIVLFAAPAVLLAENTSLAAAAGSAGALAVMAVVGGLLLSAPDPAPVPGVKLRLVQPSIPQNQKWRPERQREFFYQHLQLSRQAPDGHRDDLAGITHVIWAEASMPFLPLDSPEALGLIADMLPPGTSLLAGILRVETDPSGPTLRRGYNSLVAFGAGGKALATYDKIHLVPFGEYLPLQATLESVGLEQLSRWRGGFEIGASPRPLMRVPGLPPFVPLICYEAVFPAAVVQGAERPAAIINVTNDGWFGETSGPYQHFHQTRVRAVEEGLPLIRVANNGISAVIDSRGRILQRIGLDERRTADSFLPGVGSITIYARTGDLAFLFELLLIVAVFVAINRSSLQSDQTTDDLGA